MRTQSFVARAAAVVALASLAPLAAVARDASPDLKPTSVETVGSLRVERFGAGRPVILVPGLGCGRWVWDATIRDLEKSYSVYAVTLAGFAGVPAEAGPHIEKAEASLVKLVAAEHLDRPVIVGHSLGGHLALRTAAEHPDLFGGVFVVDSLPIFPPPTPGQTPEQRRAMAEQIAGMLKGAPDDAYARQERAAMAALVTDPKQADDATRRVLESDRATVADSIAEMMTADLRPLLPMIAAPVHVLVPVPAITPDMPDAMKSMKPDELEQAIRGQYAALYAGTPHLALETVRSSRHFVMLDQPEALRVSLAAFLRETLDIRPK